MSKGAVLALRLVELGQEDPMCHDAVEPMLSTGDVPSLVAV